MADLLRRAQNRDGGLNLSVHHRGRQELELHPGRTGNRLWLALVAYAIALLLSLRQVLAIAQSGRPGAPGPHTHLRLRSRATRRLARAFLMVVSWSCGRGDRVPYNGGNSPRGSRA